LSKGAGIEGGAMPPFFLKKQKRRKGMQEIEKEIREAIKLLGKIYKKIKEGKLDFTNSSLSVDSLLSIVKKIEKAYYQED